MAGKPLCEHPRIQSGVRVTRIPDAGRWSVDLQMRCADCGVRFTWLGVAAGLHPTEPRVSVDGFELRVPAEPDAHLTTLMAGDPATAFPTEGSE